MYREREKNGLYLSVWWISHCACSAAKLVFFAVLCESKLSLKNIYVIGFWFWVLDFPHFFVGLWLVPVKYYTWPNYFEGMDKNCFIFCPSKLWLTVFNPITTSIISKTLSCITGFDLHQSNLIPNQRICFGRTLCRCDSVWERGEDNRVPLLGMRRRKNRTCDHISFLNIFFLYMFSYIYELSLLLISQSLIFVWDSMWV